MHTIRGAWVGQTFALANCNDSGGKKARIRRSKEERKEMVESFIKKYQYSNKGSFPSLTRTYKEVGGSFYTIREIVREIIQENRVLGPANLTTEEQNAANFFDQYPLGSLSMEPHHIQVASSNGPHVLTTSNLPVHQENSIEAQVLEFSGKCQEPEHGKLDDGMIVNHSSYTSESTKDSSVRNELPVIKGLEGTENVEKERVISETKITQIATDIVVETFPVKLVAETFAPDGDSGKPKGVSGSLEENESGTMELETVNNDLILNTEVVLERSSHFVNEKDDVVEESSMSEMSCISVDEKADPSPESPYHSVKESRNGPRVDDATTDSEYKETLPAEMNHTSAPNGLKNLNSTISVSQGRSISNEAIATGKKSGSQHGSSSKKLSDPTLDRINLESWEATNDRFAGPQNNSLLSFVKALITAFVKFWSE